MTDLSEKGCDPENNAIGSLKEKNIKVEVKKKGKFEEFLKPIIIIKDKIKKNFLKID